MKPGALGRPKGGETWSSWRGLKEVKPGALGGGLKEVKPGALGGGLKEVKPAPLGWG